MDISELPIIVQFESPTDDSLDEAPEECKCIVQPSATTAHGIYPSDVPWNILLGIPCIGYPIFGYHLG